MMCADIDLRQRQTVARPTSGVRVARNFRTALCAWSILLMTMVSIYSPILGEFLTYAGLLFFLTLMVLSRRNVVDTGCLAYFVLLVLLLSLGVALSFLRTVALADLKSSMATFAMVFCLPLVYCIVKDNKESVVRALSVVIVFHSLFIFLQVGYWLSTRDYLDIFHMISGEESRSFSSFGVQAFGLIVPRFTGLFVEPGTFSVVVMAAVAALYSHTRKLTLPIAFGVVATVCTMSLFGVTLIVLLAAMHFARRGKRFRMALIALVGVVGLGALFYYAGGYAAVLERVHGSDNGFGFRREMLTFLFSSPDRTLLGVSISDYPGFVVANDIGVWFALWVSFGVAGLAVVLATILFTFRKTRSLLAVGLVVLILLTKLKFTYPLFWFLVICIVVFSTNGVQLAKQVRLVPKS